MDMHCCDCVYYVVFRGEARCGFAGKEEPFPLASAEPLYKSIDKFDNACIDFELFEEEEES